MHQELLVGELTGATFFCILWSDFLALEISNIQSYAQGSLKLLDFLWGK
jgi:hypothetical protein